MLHKTTVKSGSTLTRFYQAWTLLSVACWTGVNLWPEDFDAEKKTKMNLCCRAMPEEFYSTTKLPVIQPSSVELFLQMLFGETDEGSIAELQGPGRGAWRAGGGVARPPNESGFFLKLKAHLCHPGPWIQSSFAEGAHG